MSSLSIFLVQFWRFLCLIILNIELEVTSSVWSIIQRNTHTTLTTYWLTIWQRIQVSSYSVQQAASTGNCNMIQYFLCIADISAPPEMLTNPDFRVRTDIQSTHGTFTHLQLPPLFIRKKSGKFFSKPPLLSFPALWFLRY